MPLTHFRSVALAIFFLGGAASASATVVVSDFSSSADGWTLADNDADSTLTYEASGGNPGGFIQFSDAGEGANDVFSAPAKFLGNDDGFLNGTLNFDLAHNEPADDITTTPFVILDGSGDSLSLIISPPATTLSGPYTWTTYNLALNTSTGFVYDGGNNSSLGFNLSGGTPATLNQIITVLGNVSSIYVPADMHNGTELTGLDNFSLVTTVPEPSTWGLLAGGMSVLCAAIRRRPRMS
jgi:hypothetical protein